MVNRAGFEIVGMAVVVKNVPANRRTVVASRQLIAGHERVRRRLTGPQLGPHIAHKQPGTHAEPGENDHQRKKTRRHERQGVGNRESEIGTLDSVYRETEEMPMWK